MAMELPVTGREYFDAARAFWYASCAFDIEAATEAFVAASLMAASARFSLAAAARALAIVEARPYGCPGEGYSSFFGCLL